MMELRIRPETASDDAAIADVHRTAFPTDAEARLVRALRTAGALTLSLLAEDAHNTIGHIAFSPVIVKRPDGSQANGIGLAPMAVRPAFQRRGIGAQLIAAGLGHLRTMGCRFCVVLGHRHYYPKHGFSAAATLGLTWAGGTASSPFFVQPLQPDGLRGVSGVAHYHAAFDAL